MADIAIIAKGVPYKDFVDGILCSGWETYEWWGNWDFVPADDFDESVLTITHEDKNEPDNYVTSTFYVWELLSAYNTLVREYSSKLDHEDVDCEAGDNVLQTLVYGEVVFG